MQNVNAVNLAVNESPALVTIADMLTAAVSKFLASLDTRENTKETYSRALRAFEAWITEKGYTRPTREHILEYKLFLQERGLSALTTTAYLTALRRFFAYLEGEKVYPNVAKDIKGLKRPRGFLKDTLTREEVRRLLDGIKGASNPSIADLRDYAIINLMVHTGLRTIEVSRALIGDITREGGETVLRVWGKGKDTKDEFVILTEAAYKPILDYMQARGGAKTEEPLFLTHSNRNQTEAMSTRSLRRIIGARLKGVGLKTEKITAHSLRHTAGTVALMNGADLLSVKDMLRHSNVNTTLIYTHNINRLARGAEKFITF
jgi:integrase/recombinase XerD